MSAEIMGADSQSDLTILFIVMIIRKTNKNILKKEIYIGISLVC